MGTIRTAEASVHQLILFFSYALEARSSTDSEFGWEGVEMLRFEDKREGTKKSSTRIEG